MQQNRCHWCKLEVMVDFLMTLLWCHDISNVCHTLQEASLIKIQLSIDLLICNLIKIYLKLKTLFLDGHTFWRKLLYWRATRSCAFIGVRNFMVFYKRRARIGNIAYKFWVTVQQTDVCMRLCHYGYEGTVADVCLSFSSKSLSLFID